MTLTPGQLAKLRQDVTRQAQYLQRLTDRMFKRRFPLEDPVCANAIKAREAVFDLLRSIPVKPLRNAR